MAEAKTNHKRGFGQRCAPAAYDRYTDIAGPLQRPATADAAVAHRPVLNRRQKLKLAMLVAANMVMAVVFLAWLLHPSHLPFGEGTPWSTTRALAMVAFASLVLLELIRLIQNATLWMFAAKMRDPVPMVPPAGLRVAVLTTIVPTKEPLGVVAKTLEAMRRLEYEGHVDVWILDEGDSPKVKALARRLGVRHFSRKGRPEYNQESGAFRAKTKSGNHNAWRAEHEDEYDIVAQMDPDHCPLPAFLNRTLGFFRDPDVAFVVAPQVYGNAHESFVAHAAADQSYLFHGVVQRGANGLDAPLLIGTNHLYRREAWAQIGGYQDSIIEDHLTSLTIHTTMNPHTGRRWKGVYTPDVLAIGEGPVSFTDYFNQQKRWAFGIGDVITRHSPALLRRLTRRQRLSYAALQFFYPSVALMWVLGGVVTSLYLGLGVTAIFLDAPTWAALWGATVVGQFVLVWWLRRFNLAEHERGPVGVTGLLLSMFAGPVYAAAVLGAVTKKQFRYVVTAKGDLASRDSWRTFHLHVAWAVLAGAGLAASAVGGNSYWILRFWGCFTAVVMAAPPAMFRYGERREQRRLWAVRGRTWNEGYFAPLKPVPVTATAGTPRAEAVGGRRPSALNLRPVA